MSAASVRPAALTGQPSYPTAVEDPVGNAVPRRGPDAPRADQGALAVLRLPALKPR